MSSSQLQQNPSQSKSTKQCFADGVFTSAKKRPYREYVFDIEKDEDGKLHKRKPCRRGPLSDSTIQSIDAVKQEGGACWRCKILKKPCDAGSPCKQCQTKSGNLWKIGCRRGSLHHDLDDTIPNIVGFGSDEWFLPILDGTFLRVRQIYSNPRCEFQDLDLLALWTTPESQAEDLLMLQKFLIQFRDIEFLFPGLDLASEQRYVSLCAAIQWDLVSQSPLPPSKWPESTLLIALSLRALAKSLNYREILGVLELDQCYFSISTTSIIRKSKRKIEFRRFHFVPETASTKSGRGKSNQLRTIIQEIVKIAQRVLMKRHPPDWPYLLCILPIFLMIHADFDSHASSTHHFDDMSFSLNCILSDLCNLYTICTKDVYPFAAGDMDQAYALAARGDQLAVAHFKILNEFWIEMTGGFFDNLELRGKINYIINF